MEGKPPTERQVETLRALERRAGRPGSTPATMTEASDRIDALMAGQRGRR